MSYLVTKRIPRRRALQGLGNVTLQTYGEAQNIMMENYNWCIAPAQQQNWQWNPTTAQCQMSPAFIAANQAACAAKPGYTWDPTTNYCNANPSIQIALPPPNAPVNQAKPQIDMDCAVIGGVLQNVGAPGQSARTGQWGCVEPNGTIDPVYAVQTTADCTAIGGSVIPGQASINDPNPLICQYRNGGAVSVINSATQTIPATVAAAPAPSSAALVTGPPPVPTNPDGTPISTPGVATAAAPGFSLFGLSGTTLLLLAGGVGVGLFLILRKK